MTTETAQADADLSSNQGAQDSDRQVVVFRLATERYGVDIGTVREIIRRQTVTRVPSAPDSVEGLINLRGRTIPVVDLCRRLNLSIAEETDTSRIIVMDTGAADIGVFVDEVMEVLRVPQDSISDVASIAAHEGSSYLDGIARIDDTLLMLLDLDDALSAESLRKFKAKEFVVEADEEPEQTEEDAAPLTEATAEASDDAPPAAEPEPVVAEVVEPQPEAVEAAPDEEAAADEDAGLPFDVPLVRATFEAIAPRGEELVETFYTQLLEQYPGVAPLFEGVDLKKQQAKLLSALATVVATLTDLDTLVPHLQELGRRHVGYGAEPAHYEAVGAVLLESIASVAGDAWTPEVEAAWTGAYGVASSVMIEAAEALSAEADAEAA